MVDVCSFERPEHLRHVVEVRLLDGGFVAILWFDKPKARLLPVEWVGSGERHNKTSVEAGILPFLTAQAGAPFRLVAAKGSQLLTWRCDNCIII